MLTETVIEDEVLTGNKGKILVMDDEEMIRNVATEMARHMGYQPISCESGDKAISLYQDALKSGEIFSAVIMDLTIPGGMGGQEALQHLIALDPQVRAIASSGYSDCHTSGEYRKHGFRGSCQNPTQSGIFIGHCMKCCRGQGNTVTRELRAVTALP